jgi:hypothetical protein
MLQVNAPTVQHIAVNYSGDRDSHIPHPPKSGAKRKPPKQRSLTRQQCLDAAALNALRQLAAGGNGEAIAVQQAKAVDACLNIKVALKASSIFAQFVPTTTTPPNQGPGGATPRGGARFTLAFVPLGQIPNPIPAIVEFFNPKPKPKAKPRNPHDPWVKYQKCVAEKAQRQIDNQEKVTEAANRQACGG